MKDSDKTKDQLLEEAQRRIDLLEALQNIVTLVLLAAPGEANNSEVKFAKQAIAKVGEQS